MSGGREQEESPFVGEEDLEWIRHYARGTKILRKEEERIIKKIFDFTDIRVREILLPIEQVVSVNEKTKISEAMERIIESGYTRLPVCRENPGLIVGQLHVLDLLRARDLEQRVEDCDRKPFFVNPNTLVRDLFKFMQARGLMMAVVLGEDGGAQGIVTMEDILEEIFGEIEDEYDLKDQLFREIGEQEYLVNARIDVRELNEQLHLKIPADGYKTLSGYILHYLRRIPQEGERFTIGNLMFKIELADEKQIYKLFLRRLKA
jgi:putative hemolysin